MTHSLAIAISTIFAIIHRALQPKKLLCYLSIIFLMGCRKGDSDLSQKVLAQLSPNGELVDLSALSNFHYDRVCIFTPYTSGEVALKSLGFDWPQFNSTGIDVNDYYNTIALTKESVVVAWANIPRNPPHLDISKITETGCYLKNEARFRTQPS